ncbi:MAG: type IV toxin-antitoxin system AbiEi family antitoxin domain-containing protein [Deltaproteobacteria bacterium]|nr:type IV toxin-antitoxin system AbiEi family antitoxin domain-containing protein [Deltaproteobacteria bacterium]
MKAAAAKKTKPKAAVGKKTVKKAKVAPAKKTTGKKVAKKVSAPKKEAAKKTAKKTVKKAVKKAAKKPVGKSAVSTTPTNKVLAFMKRYKKGVSISKLKEGSGLSDKQISNILHRASKEGKIKRVARGVYKLA